MKRRVVSVQTSQQLLLARFLEIESVKFSNTCFKNGNSPDIVLSFNISALSFTVGNSMLKIIKEKWPWIIIIKV